ncbi:MAG: helix-turn-helix transcriptional regulator [bacterium]
MNELLIKIGSRIQRLRNEMRLSQERLAERAGLHPTYIGRIERGEVNPTITVLNKIASVLGMTITDLLSLPSAQEVVSKEESSTFEIIGLIERINPQHIDLLVRVLREILKWEKKM